MAEIKATRERGYASIDQEVESGLRSVAVPLLNSRGRTVAALNVGPAASAEGMEAVISQYIPLAVVGPRGTEVYTFVMNLISV